ncbi:hypothetical protein [Streptomyces antibioticus]|uniref:hypothetical protein n=1 Tax=Streptomyces antibioticus TaxID=1890 RepID=UPI002257C966|nr:hypothetical protein [Streptomyces antibioticus]MCX4743790.1 hypothetical protein [Streptomyces antibioticus]
MTAAREAVKLQPEWSMMNFVSEGTRIPTGMQAPAEYLELLEIANGGIFGRIVIFDAKAVKKMQFHADDIEGSPVRLGRDGWFCLGKVNDDPIFVDRNNGSVWGFPERGVVWWQSDTFECWAGSVGDFILRYIFGPGYRSVCNAPEDDQWWRLLRRIGRVE